MLTAKEVANVLEANLLQKVYDDAEVEPNFHDKLVAELQALGWKYAESHSFCKVASKENHLSKGGKFVEIITANLLGRFHQISSHYRVR